MTQEKNEGWALVVASGPSLLQADVDLLMAHVDFTVAVNCAVNYARDADELYFADKRWHSKYVKEQGEQTLILDRDKQEYFPFEGQMVSLNFARWNIQKYRPRNWLRNGGNSGHQGLQRAVDSGYKNIVLLGFDHMRRKRSDGSIKAHFHKDHPDRMPNAVGVINWRNKMDKTAEDLKRMGIEVVNLSRETALTCFPRMGVEDFLEREA